jgi:zinc protease
MTYIHVRVAKFVAAMLFPLSCLLYGITAIAGNEKDASNSAVTRQNIQAGGVTSYVLPNGFKVILLPFAPADKVGVRLVVRSGSADEGYGESGMAHLLEHMLFKSAGDRADIKQDLTRLEAEFNGFTNADSTQYLAAIPADQGKLEQLLSIEADRFIRASFTKEHLKSEMTVVRNELELRDTDAGNVVMRTLWRQSFSTHGYGRPTIGARSDIENAPFEALQAFHQRHYRPDNAFIVVSGEFDLEKTSAVIDKLFAPAKNPELPKVTRWTREPAQTVNTRAELALAAGQVMAVSAWKLPPDYNREGIAFRLAATAICSTEWGSLRKALVLESKISNDAACDIENRKDASLFTAGSSGGKQDSPEAISKALVAHIETAAKAGITQESLDRAKLEMRNVKETIESNPSLIVPYLIEAEIAGDWRLILWNLDVIQEISQAEANATLTKWIAPFGRSDVLLRHQDDAASPEIPLADKATDVIGGKTWAPSFKSGDPLPHSFAELRQATQLFTVGAGVRVALVTRKNRGDKVWFKLHNYYSNPDYTYKHGLACLLTDQLMGMGGNGYDLDQFTAAMSKLNADGAVGLDGISLSVSKKSFAPAFDLLLAMWQAPSLPEAEFNSTKSSLLANMDAVTSNPVKLASEAVSFRFDNYPEGHPLKAVTFAKSRAEIQALTYEDVKSCWTEMAGLSNYTITVVGNMTKEEVESLWETRIKSLPQSKIPYEQIRAIAPPEAINVSPVVVQMPNKPNASIRGTGMLAVTDASPEFGALRLAFNILGDGAESRIWKTLREKDGLAYSASSTLSPNSIDPRTSFEFSATAASSNWERALAALNNEVAGALEKGFTEAEVDAARKQFLADRKPFFANESRYIGTLDRGLYLNRDQLQFMSAYDEGLGKLTAKDVTDAFRKHVQLNKIVWSIGGGS